MWPHDTIFPLASSGQSRLPAQGMIIYVCPFYYGYDHVDRIARWTYREFEKYRQ